MGLYARIPSLVNSKLSLQVGSSTAPQAPRRGGEACQPCPPHSIRPPCRHACNKALAATAEPPIIASNALPSGSRPDWNADRFLGWQIVTISCFHENFSALLRTKNGALCQYNTVKQTVCIFPTHPSCTIIVWHFRVLGIILADQEHCSLAQVDLPLWKFVRGGSATCANHGSNCLGAFFAQDFVCLMARLPITCKGKQSCCYV